MSTSGGARKQGASARHVTTAHHAVSLAPRSVQQPNSRARDMPTLAIVTNVPGDRLKASEAIRELSSAVAKLCGKPEQVRLDAPSTQRALGGSACVCRGRKCSSKRTAERTAA